MEVKARAPGKIILSGEHAVVHGSTAVAASINLYTYATLRFPTPSGNLLSLSLSCLIWIWVIGKKLNLHEFKFWDLFRMRIGIYPFQQFGCKSVMLYKSIILQLFELGVGFYKLK